MRRSWSGDQVFQNLLRHGQRDRRSGDRGIRDQLDQRAFQLANIRFGFRRDVDAHVLRQRDAFHLRFLVQNRHLGFEIGRLNVHHQAPLESGPQALHQARRAFRRGIARDHDLLLMIVEFVEGVKELFLRPFLAGQDLDVVDQQHIGGAVVAMKRRHPVRAEAS